MQLTMTEPELTEKVQQQSSNAQQVNWFTLPLVMSGDDVPSSVIFDIRCNRGNGGGDSLPSLRSSEKSSVSPVC
jgi:hypothetical protein